MTYEGSPHPAIPELSSVPTSLPSRVQGRDLSFIAAINVVLQNSMLVAVCTGATFLLVVLALVLKSPEYISVSSFIPQSGRSSPGVAGIAAQFGLFVQSGEQGQSPAFYSDLVKTREILAAVVDSRYAVSVPSGPDSVTLVDLYGQGPPTPPMRRDAAIRKLRKSVAVNVSLKTGVLELSVVARDPALAMQVNTRILELVSEFNLRRRQSQAASERRFIERRLDEVRLELRSAEDRLQAFLQNNRDYRTSPKLTFDEDRLAREIQMRQQVYNMLAQSFEQAKIEEVRDTPVITVIDQADLPLVPNGKGFLRNGILALIAGFILGLCWAFGSHMVRAELLGNTDDLSRFHILASDAVRSVLHPWRAFRHSRSDDPNTL